MPAPTLVASTANAQVSSVSSSFAAQVPAVAAGDVTLLTVSTLGTGAATPTGWTLVIVSDTLNSGTTYVFRRTAPAAAAATTVTLTGSNGYWASRAAVYSGVDTSSPIAGTAKATGTTTVGATAPAVTATGTDPSGLRRIAVIGLSDNNQGMGSAPASWSQVGFPMGAFYQRDTYDAAAQQFPYQFTTNNLSWTALSVVLRGFPDNRPPNAPTLTTMADGGTVAADEVNRAAHSHSDPDGDAQTAFDHHYRLVDATAWTDLARQTTPNQFYDFPAASLAPGEYEREVRTYDNKTVGPWSSAGRFTVANRPGGPTITDPLNGQTIPSDTYTGTISYPALQSWEFRVFGDNAGVADPNVIIIPTTTRPADQRTFVMSGLSNNTTVHVQARVKVDDLWSAWTDHTNPVSYTPPAVPLVVVTYADGPGTASIGVVHPAPGPGQPTVIAQHVDRVELDNGVEVPGTRVRRARGMAAGATFDDGTIANRQTYGWLVVADAANGTTRTSALTT